MILTLVILTLVILTLLILTLLVLTLVILTLLMLTNSTHTLLLLLEHRWQTSLSTSVCLEIASPTVLTKNLTAALLLG